MPLTKRSLVEEYASTSEVTQETVGFLEAMFRISKVNNAIADVQDKFSSGEISDFEANARLKVLLDHFDNIKHDLYVVGM